MTFAIADRATSRKALAQLFETALVGTGKPVQAVYDYQVSDFDNRSPVIVVTSSGARRFVFGDDLSAQNEVFLDVYIFVLYADGNTYTEADSEDDLDAVEKAVQEILLLNSDRQLEDDPEWLHLEQIERSTVEPALIGGAEYRSEVIPLKLTVTNPG